MKHPYDQELDRQTNAYLKKQSEYDNYVEKVMEHIESENDDLDNWLNDCPQVDEILDKHYKIFSHCLTDQVYKNVAAEITSEWNKKFEY